jgi:cytochrome-b5 reductase
VFKVIYANKTFEDILLKDELDQMQANYPEKLQVSYVLESTPKKWRQNIGLISKDILSKELPLNNDEHGILVCGPEGYFRI